MSVDILNSNLEAVGLIEGKELSIIIEYSQRAT